MAKRVLAPDSVSTLDSRQILVALQLLSVLSMVSTLLAAGLFVLAARSGSASLARHASASALPS